MHEAKSVNTQGIKNLNDLFSGQWSIVEKNEVKVEKQPPSRVGIENGV